MRNKMIMGILLVLITVLGFLSSEGFSKKIKNENNNNKLILAFDYNDFASKAQFDNIKMESVADDLKSMKVNGVLVKELRMYELKVAGKVYYENAGSYLAGLNKSDIKLVEKIKKGIGLEKVNPYSPLITTISSEMDLLLQNRFSKRLFQDEYIRFVIDGQYYYYFYKSFEAGKLSIGFDEDFIDEYSKKGFQIVLMPYNNDYNNTMFLDEYEDLIVKYNIRNIIFDTETVIGYPDNLDKVINILNRNNIIISMIEGDDQILYLPQNGIETVVEGVNNNFTRAYFIKEEFLENADSNRYLSILERATIDRGIRLVILQQTVNTQLNDEENFMTTMNGIKLFTKVIEDFDYQMDKQMEPMDTEKTSYSHEFYVIILIALLLLLYLFLFSFKNIKYKVIFIFILTVFLVLLKVINIINISPILSLIIAILIPSISTIIILKSLNYNLGKFDFTKYLTFPILVFSLSIFGGYIINTTLYDIKYLNNIMLFKGIKVAFIMPLLLYIVNFMICFMDFKSTSKLFINFTRNNISYLSFAIIGIGCIFVFIYIARSGSTFSFLVSSYELKFRHILENIFYLRPRFKEFLLGYPALFSSIYLYNKYKSKIIIFVLGFLITSLSVSIVNSFSHTAAMFKLSFIRSLNGLFLGVLVSVLLLFLIIIVEKLYPKILKKN